MKRIFVVMLLFSLAVTRAASIEEPQQDSVKRLTVADFSSLRAGDELPAEWQLLTVPRIPRHTQYMLASVDGTTVLRAEAEASMASLARELSVDPNETPWLQWRWRIQQLNGQSDLNSKQGDDFPARIYVFHWQWDVPR